MFSLIGCSDSGDEIDDDVVIIDDETEEEELPEETISYANIDFSTWKVTLPVDENNNGRPDEYQPSQLINFGYQSLDAVQPYMYDDTSDASIVFTHSLMYLRQIVLTQEQNCES